MVLAGLLAMGLAWTSRVESAGSVSLPLLVADPNTVPSPVLMALPMIGPTLAGNIVEARAARPFDSIEDFDRRVRGIGPARVAALRTYLRFDSTPLPHP